MTQVPDMIDHLFIDNGVRARKVQFDTKWVLIWKWVYLSWIVSRADEVQQEKLATTMVSSQMWYASFWPSVCMWQWWELMSQIKAWFCSTTQQPAQVQGRTPSWEWKAEQSIRVNIKGTTQPASWTWTIQGVIGKEGPWLWVGNNSNVSWYRV